MKIAFSILLSLLFNLSILAQDHKAAIITIYTDNMGAHNKSSEHEGAYRTQDPSWDYVSLVNEFGESVINEITPLFPFPFVEKENVVNAAGYQELSENIKLPTTTGELGFNFKEGVVSTKNSYIPSTDYIVIPSFGVANKEAIDNAFDILPSDVDLVLVAYVNYTLSCSTAYDSKRKRNITTNKLVATGRLKIYNKDGDKVLSQSENLTSDISVETDNERIPNLGDFDRLYNDVKNGLIAGMKKDVSKKLAKMNKKI